MSKILCNQNKKNLYNIYLNLLYNIYCRWALVFYFVSKSFSSFSKSPLHLTRNVTSNVDRVILNQTVRGGLAMRSSSISHKHSHLSRNQDKSRILKSCCFSDASTNYFNKKIFHFINLKMIRSLMISPHVCVSAPNNAHLDFCQHHSLPLLVTCPLPHHLHHLISLHVSVHFHMSAFHHFLIILSLSLSLSHTTLHHYLTAMHLCRLIPYDFTYIFLLPTKHYTSWSMSHVLLRYY